jgi:hypothetical protein
MDGWTDGERKTVDLALVHQLNLSSKILPTEVEIRRQSSRVVPATTGL